MARNENTGGDADQNQPDDGLTVEERAQFDQMRRDEPPPVEGGDPAPASDAPIVPPDTGADDDGDDDGDEAAAGQPAAGQPRPDAKPGEPAADGEARKPRRVPYKRFEKSEGELAAARAELKTKDDIITRFDERMKMLNEALTPPQQAAAEKAKDDDPKPNKEDDIIGYMDWQDRQLERVNNTLKQMQDGSASERADRDLQRSYSSDAERFAAAEPNFWAAYNHLLQTRYIELAQVYYGVDATAPGATLTPKQIEHIKAQAYGEEKELAQSAIKAQMSPAERIFSLARARGFRPADPAAAAGVGAVAQPGPAGNEAARAAAPASAGKPAAVPGALNGGAPAAPSVVDEIARIKNGQDAATSLSNGGGQPSNPMSVEKLVNMSQDEFNEYMETITPAQQRALMGG